MLVLLLVLKIHLPAKSGHLARCEVSVGEQGLWAQLLQRGSALVHIGRLHGHEVSSERRVGADCPDILNNFTFLFSQRLRTRLRFASRVQII